MSGSCEPGTANRTRIGLIWLITTSGAAPAGTGEIPRPHEKAARPPGNRRFHGRVVEIELRRGEVGAVGLQRRRAVDPAVARI